jgi:hypothetical protein
MDFFEIKKYKLKSGKQKAEIRNQQLKVRN